MQRGNPYHDSRGRFTSPYGAYDPGRDSNINETAHYLADAWQESYSEIDPDDCTDDWGEATEEAYEQAMAREFREKEEELREEITDVYAEYNAEMRNRIAKMDYDALDSWSRDMDSADGDIRRKLKSRHADVEEAVDAAAEDFDTDVGDYRYRRLVSKTNSRYLLYRMASDEKDGYGLNGYANDYATQRIKASGFEDDYENYLLAKKAYEDGDHVLGKKPSEFGSELDYIKAKMKQIRKGDEKNA